MVWQEPDTPGLLDMNRVMKRCKLFQQMKLPVQLLSISILSPQEIATKIEYVACLCIIDKHGRLPEAVGILDLMMDYNEAGRPCRNFYVGIRNKRTWHALNWCHFHLVILKVPAAQRNRRSSLHIQYLMFENNRLIALEQQQLLPIPDIAYEPIPKVTVRTGSKELLSWIIQRIAEQDFQPLEEVRHIATSFLASQLEQDKKMVTCLPTDRTYFLCKNNKHMLDYTDMSNNESATIDRIIEEHLHESVTAVCVLIATTCGISITTSHMQGVRRGYS
ncbi:hypothetical protein FFLO_06470 [Filobasidium floriforme]|uniref:Uncharacterized protein n=1 Tax=Filobasidium floriforme TaxID=5210 RepID=A0A8K0JEW0_9TREE|nr:uncharacterized protein HD553DRAFT_327066 [Filobasidium floriforme]KAG7527996.1 hypothetical protein FFLO_06470 [Filobasidium floriforme]KAH8077986.1 hypothetical protein HD553DRAFT_327066 [Filobasidium floriforme]